MHFLAAILSSLSSSVTSLFGKLSYVLGATPTQILFIRFSISFIISLIIFLIFKKSFKIKYFLIFGFLGVLNYGIAAYLFFYGLNFLNPAFATVIFFTNPIFVLIFQWVFHKYKINFLSIISIFISFIGVVLANIGEANLVNDNTIIIGTLIVLGSSSLNALFITITGRRIKKINSGTIENVFYTFFGTALYYLFFSLITKELFSIKYEYLNYGFMLAIFSTFVPLTLNFFALKKLESHSLAIIMPLEIVFASLLSYLIFGEIFNIIKVLGFIFVGIAPVIENIKKIKDGENA
ncbi:hypothetical protein Ob7_06628 [Thermosipho africanus Ob7]|uniref:DMT family transporter n=1 Tax=Thermosipho africanus TaxID=2421 RepID=UPI000E09E8F9|nr:DMT family transporter [Thermosipho africanus]RDI91115.1 hypothetical protein Ob7_06628 [Thermosipho africanus Ob7]